MDMYTRRQGVWRINRESAVLKYIATLGRGSNIVAHIGGIRECYECGLPLMGDVVWIDPNCNRFTKGLYGEPFHRECAPEGCSGDDADPNYVTDGTSFQIWGRKKFCDAEEYFSPFDDIAREGA